jgi:hypothetical protein
MMNRSRFRWSLLGVIAVTAALAGCGPKELPKETTYRVHGRVTINGQPVRHAMLMLEPLDQRGHPAEGSTDADGAFDLHTYSNEEADGVVAASYRVKLEEYDLTRVGPLGKGQKPTAIPKELLDTGRTIEIKEEDNELDIDLP